MELNDNYVLKKDNHENYIYIFHQADYNEYKVKVASGKLSCTETTFSG